MRHGREIYLFFNIYGIYGLIGIIISSVITGIVVNKVLNCSKENKTQNYYKLLEKINKKNNKKIILIVNLFLLISFFIMIAGFSAYINQEYNLEIYISSIFFVIICGLIFLKNIEGIIKVNEVLVPILIISIIYLGIKNITYISNSNIILEILEREYTIKEIINAIIKSILYTSYNSIILIPVLTNIKIENINKKQIKIISIISSIVISILAILIFGILLRGTNYIQELEMPIIGIVSEFGNWYKYFYGMIIIISIFTSAISAGYGFLQNVSKTKKQYKIYLLIISLIGVIVSNIGFGKLVEILYPIFGVLGLIQILLFINYKITIEKKQ